MNPQDSTHRIPQPAATDANRDVRLHPPEYAPELGEHVPARIELAGAFFQVWVTPAGDYEMSVDLTDAAPWLRGSDGTVSLRLSDRQEKLFAVHLQPPARPAEPDDGPAGVILPMYRNGRRRPYPG